MPLDTIQKINHILQVVQRTFSGRQKNVVFVYEAGAGTYTYLLTSVVFRHEKVIEPTIPDPGAGPSTTVADTQIIAPLGTNTTGLVMVADTTTATSAGVAAAQKYEVIEVLPVGIVPGGSHLRLICRRFR